MKNVFDKFKYAPVLMVVFQIIFIVGISAQLHGAQIIYVDNQLSADCAGTYSIANRDSSGSDGDAYTTLAGAAAVTTPGDEVVIRGGVFSEQLSPENSGEPDNYITYRNYQDEVVEITGATINPGIWIDRKDYIIIEGLEVREVRRWLNALGSEHLIIRNNVFERALDEYGSSKTGVFMQACTYVKILNNKLHDTTQDNLGMVDCDYNLIEGNTITKAYHTLWTFKCSHYNIIRNNYFHNELQKIGEIYDCENSGYGDDGFPKLNSLDDSKYNVVEDNIFAHTASSGDASPYAGIQYAGQKGIIRNNVFYECIGPPFDLTLYGGEATYNYSNRIYHNVFHDNDFGGISISGNTSHTFHDQKIKNNLLYKNKFVRNDTRWAWYKTLDNKPVQIVTGRTDGVLFENNNIFHTQADELYVIAHGVRTASSSNPAPKSLSWWETNNPQMFTNNVQAEPNLTDPSNYDFHLQTGSPMIDAGAFLAKTTNPGTNSTVMQVDDAGWFIDGFGIVSGDTIQLEGQTDRAILVSVDYSTNTLTLDRPLSWSAGSGIGMQYRNSAPDIGAFEFDDGEPLPTPPMGRIVYVDNQLSSDCAGTYSIANRDSTGFDGYAFTTLAGAAAVATPGMDVVIRGGVFAEKLVPINSGEPDNYITYKNYQDEVAEITWTALNPAIMIHKVNYIAIEGLTVRNVRRWLNALGCDYLIIKDNTFESALDQFGSSKSGVFLQACNYAKILNNKLHDTTQDNLTLVDSDYNLIEGNTITKAYHTLWALKCSHYNIIRNNYFHNELQKIGEIYDCENAGFGLAEFPKLNSLDDAKYNVVEDNIFAHTASSGDASPYAGIQYAGQHGIIRNNVFYECIGPPVDLTLYADEATYNYGNRVYHNVFHDNDFGGISISGNTSHTFHDQKIKNNLLYKNKFVRNDTRWAWYKTLDNKPVQIMTGRTDEVLFENNNIFHSQADELYAITHGVRTASSTNPSPKSLSWWETNHPQMFKNNVQTEPNLTDPVNHDYYLQEGSPMIDAGAFLAKTTNPGTNSTVMQVDDAGWFIDGFGIVTGDTIQLEGQIARAILESVDYGTNTLTLDRPLSWITGQGVSKKYRNAAPDIGAFEFDDGEPETSLSGEDGAALPASFHLSAFPNPFNPSTTVSYDLPQDSNVELAVYNISGRKVVQLVSEYHMAGAHTISWNAEDVRGRRVASGIYFLRIRAEAYGKTIKMMYIQ